MIFGVPFSGSSLWRINMMIGRQLIVLLFGAALVAMNPLAVSAEEIVGKGTFSGKSGHKTSGSVSIIKTSTGVEVRLGSNFKQDGAPDPWLGFGKSGKYDSASEIAVLKSKTGAQVYKIAGNIDVSKYDELYVWCKKFSVPLGVAKLK